VPSTLSNSQVELAIFNINGQLIKKLIHQNLPSGNYLAKWNGTNESGKYVASGTYICNLTVGNKQKVSKLLLLK
jgi:flagellar hook assembly protein FlgD